MLCARTHLRINLEMKCDQDTPTRFYLEMKRQKTKQRWRLWASCDLYPLFSSLFLSGSSGTVTTQPDGGQLRLSSARRSLDGRLTCCATPKSGDALFHLSFPDDEHFSCINTPCFHHIHLPSAITQNDDVLFLSWTVPSMSCTLQISSTHLERNTSVSWGIERCISSIRLNGFIDKVNGNWGVGGQTPVLHGDKCQHLNSKVTVVRGFQLVARFYPNKAAQQSLRQP